MPEWLLYSQLTSLKNKTYFANVKQKDPFYINHIFVEYKNSNGLYLFQTDELWGHFEELLLVSKSILKL